MKKICVVTSTRADYGILRPLLRHLEADSDFELALVATGTHVAPEFGMTCGEIEADGFTIDARIETLLSSDTPAAMSKSMGMALISFADYFGQKRPDLLLVLGDRFEMAAVCEAAVNARIPIAHIHGGETTVGAVDECYRHAITKMSSLHFTSCALYRKRVVQLGENPARVFNVGALAVENIKNVPILSLAELEGSLGFPLSQRPFAVVTFHPVTLEDGTGEGQVLELMAALDRFPQLDFIITKSNADAGGRAINRLWDAHAKERDNWLVVTSLGSRRYLSALQYAKVMIGNSSSGILEGPCAGLPAVNVGQRQRGRLMADGVICCSPDETAIARAIGEALDPAFQQRAVQADNPYGDGHTSDNIMAVLRDYVLGEKLSVQKEFYDIPFEVQP